MMAPELPERYKGAIRGYEISTLLEGGGSPYNITVQGDSPKNLKKQRKEPLIIFRGSPPGGP